MSHTKEELNKLSLVELKLLCKEYRIASSGTKAKLIKSILDIEKPVPVTVNTSTEYKPPKDKKIIGLKSTDHNKRLQIGRLREKNDVIDLYYSMGVHYYLVNKDFEFV